MPYLQIIGGLALLYIGVKLLIEEEEDEAGNKVSKTLMFAIWSILVADFSMSLDNILAVALAAKVNGHVNYILLLMGLVISIPIIMGAAAILTQLIDRFPIIKYIGALLIGWVAGDAIFHDPFSQGLLTKGETPGAIMAMEYLIKGACAVFVVGMGAASYFISHNPSTEP
jgi:YjbE family integral membrane protein